MTKQVMKIRSVSVDGGSCPDGDTCPTLCRTDAGTLIVQGYPVTEPAVLGQLRLDEGKTAVEVPEALRQEPHGRSCPDGDAFPVLCRTDAGTLIVQGYPVTEPAVLGQLKLGESEIAVEVPRLLDAAELGNLIRSRFGRLACRVETLDRYDVGSDGADVARYLRGEPDPDPARKGAWLSRLRAERAAGKLRQVVHVLRGPLSPYLRYECEWGYLPNVAAGQDVRILDLAERPRPPALDLDHDFWVLDDQLAVRMHYDQDGRFLGAEVVPASELARYRAAWEAAIRAAEPFTSYWRRHPEYYRANQAA